MADRTWLDEVRERCAYTAQLETPPDYDDARDAIADRALLLKVAGAARALLDELQHNDIWGPRIEQLEEKLEAALRGEVGDE